MYIRQVRRKRQDRVISLDVDRNNLLHTARQRRKHCFQIALLVLGTVSGQILFRSFQLSSRSGQPFSCRLHSLNGAPRHGSPVSDKEVMVERLLFVGVLTSRRYLKSRAEAVYRTWGSLLNGSISFFVGSGKSILYDLPVVVLSDVVDDEYPPRRKSFAMLKFLHRRHGKHFRWFLRADDDLFVDVRRLETLLFSLNSSQWGYIGHPGTGRSWEVGNLGLPDESPYCMGGPGVLLSRDVLVALSGILSECERNTVSGHEDSELGRCVYNATRLTCSTSSKVYVMKNIFFFCMSSVAYEFSFSNS